MNVRAVRELQRAIEMAMQQYDCAFLQSIEMDRGSEVTNLASCASVRVHMRDGSMRGFTIVAKEFAEWVFTAQTEWPNHPAPEFIGVWTTGGPLALVREITGDSIVRAVIRYIELEEGRAGY
jgi:hypothetical protein